MTEGVTCGQVPVGTESANQGRRGTPRARSQGPIRPSRLPSFTQLERQYHALIDFALIYLKKVKYISLRPPNFIINRVRMREPDLYLLLCVVDVASPCVCVL
jgi:hypothetical protein